MPNRRRLAALLAVIVLACCGVNSSFAKTPAAADGEASVAAPPLPPIASIQLDPPSLTLSDARDARQVLVWGLTADGQRFDLSDVATFKSDSDTVAIDADAGHHYVVAKAAGEGSVIVNYEGISAKLPVKVTGAAVPDVRFVKDVMPVLAKAGCNAGTCHGARVGKNGFKLSLRGYDPDYDYDALMNDLQGRRFDRVRPERSLMLLKPTGQVTHEGRKVFDADSRYYHLVLDWIKQGAARDPQPSTARATSVEVLPGEVALDLPGRTQRLVVIARYPDGSTRDVTREAILSSNNEEVARIKDNQVAGVRRGEAAILVRYEGNYGAVGVSVMGDRAGFSWRPMPEFNFIDRHVNAKLQKRKTLPSDEISDADFVRRAYLDLTGLIPTAQQARTFIEDKTPRREKRTKLVDSLIGNKDFIAFWSNKWADLLQCNSKALGENAVWAYREWIRQAVAQNKPYDQFVRELLLAQGSSYTNPATNYYRALKDKDDAGKLMTNKITEDVSQTFLGVRFNCNKCHDHPFERWTQQQYYEFGAFFARVAFKPGPRPGEEVVYTSFRGGEVRHPRTDKVMDPTVPYGQEPDVAAARFRQEAFANWLTSADNPLFAKSYVNRVWSYFLGRGIIDPVDDIRASNPPVNPELLDALTQDFVAHRFDTRHLIRTIVLSRTYQTSFVPNKWNEDDKINFSHAIPRRLSAEQMLDAVALATGTHEKVQGLPENFRSVYLADGMAAAGGDDFLKLFGRPKRETACECERTSNVSLAHALNLINGPMISNAVAEPTNKIAKLVKEQPDNARAVEEIYYAILNRPPTEQEKSIDLGQGEERLAVAQDLAWALLNSPAFLFNR